jgi:hypothetical protein
MIENMNLLFHPIRRSDLSAWNTLYSMYAIINFCCHHEPEDQAYQIVNYQIWNPVEFAVDPLMGVDTMDALLRSEVQGF